MTTFYLEEKHTSRFQYTSDILGNKRRYLSKEFIYIFNFQKTREGDYKNDKSYNL
jgi:hypothetical protein